jgi:PTS system fructose-specific IIB component
MSWHRWARSWSVPGSGTAQNDRASDTSVSQDRFSGVPLIDGTVKDAGNDAEEMIINAVEAADRDTRATETDAGSSKASAGSDQQRRRGGDRSKSLVARLKRLFS